MTSTASAAANATTPMDMDSSDGGEDDFGFLKGENASPNKAPIKRRRTPDEVNMKNKTLTEQDVGMWARRDPQNLKQVLRLMDAVNGRGSRTMQSMADLFYVVTDADSNVVMRNSCAFGPSPAWVVSMLGLQWFPILDPVSSGQHSTDAKLTTKLLKQMKPEPTSTRKRLGKGTMKTTVYLRLRLRNPSRAKTLRDIENILMNNGRLLVAILGGLAAKEAEAATAVES